MIPKVRIDLYSDTSTRPTPGMRKAMAEAEVGNEQAKEDPTTNRLIERVAELLGKEDAVFLPSGSMCNAVAYRVHCQQGDEVICDKTAHVIHYEVGGPAALSGVMMRPMEGVDGVFTAAQAEEAVRNPKINHHPRTRLISIEQTSMGGGGTIWPQATIRALGDLAKKHKLAYHMDGARLMNAAIGSGLKAKEIAGPVDSTWLDLTKGLGCPVVAVLAGTKDFIAQAWRWKHQFGGAMRQSGIIAAAGLYALDHNVERLAEDHANAKRMATMLAEIPGVKVDPKAIQTNIVFFDVSGTGLTAFEIHERLMADGIRIGARAGGIMRALTHLDVTKAQVEEAIQALARAVKEGRPKAKAS